MAKIQVRGSVAKRVVREEVAKNAKATVDAKEAEATKKEAEAKKEAKAEAKKARLARVEKEVRDSIGKDFWIVRDPEGSDLRERSEVVKGRLLGVNEAWGCSFDDGRLDRGLVTLISAESVAAISGDTDLLAFPLTPSGKKEAEARAGECTLLWREAVAKKAEAKKEADKAKKEAEKAKKVKAEVRAEAKAKKEVVKTSSMRHPADVVREKVTAKKAKRAA